MKIDKIDELRNKYKLELEGSLTYILAIRYALENYSKMSPIARKLLNALDNAAEEQNIDIIS